MTTSLAILAILVFWLIGAHNRLSKLRHRQLNAFSPLCHALRQRHVVALTLAEAARNLRGAPGEQVEAVIAAAHRATAANHAPQIRQQAESLQRIADAEEALGQALDTLVHTLHDLSFGATPDPAVSELLRQRHALQGQIIFAAQVYNDTARTYNDALTVFPTPVAARLLRFEPAPAFLHALVRPAVLLDSEQAAHTRPAALEDFTTSRVPSKARPGDLI